MKTNINVDGLKVCRTEKQWAIARTIAAVRGQRRPFLCLVSFPVWLACLAEALARLFLQFPFSPFFTSSLSPVGRGR